MQRYTSSSFMWRSCWHTDAAFCTTFLQSELQMIGWSTTENIEFVPRLYSRIFPLTFKKKLIGFICLHECKISKKSLIWSRIIYLSIYLTSCFFQTLQLGIITACTCITLFPLPAAGVFTWRERGKVRCRITSESNVTPLSCLPPNRAVSSVCSSHGHSAAMPT